MFVSPHAVCTHNTVPLYLVPLFAPLPFPSPLDPETYLLQVSDLKQALKTKGLPVSGKKAELLARLRQAPQPKAPVQ